MRDHIYLHQIAEGPQITFSKADSRDYSILKLFMCIETICGKKVTYKDSDVRQCIQEYGAFRIGEREGQFCKIFEN